MRLAAITTRPAPARVPLRLIRSADAADAGAIVALRFILDSISTSVSGPEAPLRSLSRLTSARSVSWKIRSSSRADCDAILSSSMTSRHSAAWFADRALAERSLPWNDTVGEAGGRMEGCRDAERVEKVDWVCADTKCGGVGRRPDMDRPSEKREVVGEVEIVGSISISSGDSATLAIEERESVRIVRASL